METSQRRVEPPYREPEVHYRGREAAHRRRAEDGRRNARSATTRRAPSGCPSSSSPAAAVRRRSDALARGDARVRQRLAERVQGAKNTIVPNYVTETGYTEDIPRAPTSAIPRIAVFAILNLKTGKTVWADGSFAPPVSETEKPAASGRRARRQTRPRGRTRDPLVDAVGVRRREVGVASARSADNKDRWFVTLDPETGKTKVIDTLHDELDSRAGVRRLQHRVPAQQPAGLVPSERDGWMHLYTLDLGAVGPGRPS